jgi:hypothetical protein
MIAFHGDSSIKAKYVARVKAHAVADEIVHGQYWKNGKGCAVGCTIHSGDHAAYEREIGVPVILARLEDRLFEAMQNGDAKEFPLRFISAIRPGADLSRVWYQFALWLLVDAVDGVIKFAKTEKTKEAILSVAALYSRAARGETVEREEWLRARKDAAAYAYADAYAAAAAYAADAAESPKYAEYAAYAADASALLLIASRPAGAADARRKAYKRQADKLIELLEAA